jgi:hypothetical protein
VTDKQRPGVSPPRLAPSKGTAPPETSNAITDELGPTPRRGKARRLATRDSGPEISVAQAPAGRETLAAITEELLGDARAPGDTLPYADRVPNAPGAVTPSSSTELRSDPARAPKSRRSAAPAARPDATQVFEVRTFVLYRADADSLKSEQNRRRFVESRLLARLPVRSMQRVTRIDLTPWTEPDTLVLRVWLQVDQAR